MRGSPANCLHIFQLVSRYSFFYKELAELFDGFGRGFIQLDEIVVENFVQGVVVPLKIRAEGFGYDGWTRP